jgi:hypothetical protein
MRKTRFRIAIGILALSTVTTATVLAADASAAGTPALPKISTPDQPEFGFTGVAGGVAILTARAEAVRILNAAIAAAARRAVAAQPRASSGPGASSQQGASSGPDGGSVNWDAIARCETGGNWSMHGSSYSGGLGFANTTWNGFGGREFAGNAGDATREQQITVALRVYARYGLSGWGCRRFG